MFVAETCQSNLFQLELLVGDLALLQTVGLLAADGHFHQLLLSSNRNDLLHQSHS